MGVVKGGSGKGWEWQRVGVAKDGCGKMWEWQRVGVVMGTKRRNIGFTSTNSQEHEIDNACCMYVLYMCVLFSSYALLTFCCESDTH